MPPFTRRHFLVLTGVTVLATWLLKNRNPEFLPISESPMPSLSTSLVFASGYAKADQAGIHAFVFDETNGTLAPHGSFAGITNPSFIVIHPNQRWLYAVSETDMNSAGKFGEVWAFRVERDPFTIEAINHQTTRGDWPCHLRIDATGKWIIATNYGTGNAAIYPIQADGLLGEMTDFVQHHGSGPNAARQEGPHAHSSIFTPDNRFAIIADLGIDQLVFYELDTNQGKLVPHGIVNSQQGAGPRHLVFHPNGKWLYASNELASTVTFFEYDDANGTLIEREFLSTIPSDSPENIVADIHISPTGKRLYVSNRGHNSIAAFDVNADGTLTLLSISTCGGNWPRNFALSPNEQFMLVANQYSNEICVLPILDGKEALGAPVSRVTVTGASCIQFA
jgi:6-phosphogluconolactonase